MSLHRQNEFEKEAIIRARKKRPFNVISLDHSWEGGIIQAIWLNKLLKEFPHLLRDTDLIIGTGSSSSLALSLATFTEIPTDCGLWIKALNFITKQTVKGSKYTYLQYSNLKNLLRLHFGDLCIGDIRRPVYIPYINLARKTGPKPFNWKTTVIYYPSPIVDPRTSVAELALRSTVSLPEFHPRHNYFSASLISPNPTMTGVCYYLGQALKYISIENVHILSIGGGKLTSGGEYIFGSEDPDFYLIEEAAKTSIDDQALFLFKHNYYRLDTIIDKKYPLLSLRENGVAEQIKTLARQADQHNLQDVKEWITLNWI